jgi:hypothetical protein
MGMVMALRAHSHACCLAARRRRRPGVRVHLPQALQRPGQLQRHVERAPQRRGPFQTTRRLPLVGLQVVQLPEVSQRIGLDEAVVQRTRDRKAVLQEGSGLVRLVAAQGQLAALPVVGVATQVQEVAQRPGKVPGQLVPSRVGGLVDRGDQGGPLGLQPRQRVAQQGLNRRGGRAPAGRVTVEGAVQVARQALIGQLGQRQPAA